MRSSDGDVTVAFFIVDSAAIELHYSDSRESNAEVKIASTMRQKDGVNGVVRVFQFHSELPKLRG